MNQKHNGLKSPCCAQALTAQGEKYLLCKAHLGFHSPKPWEESFYLWPKRRVSLTLPNSHLVEYKNAKVFLTFSISISHLYQTGKERGLEGKKP